MFSSIRSPQVSGFTSVADSSAHGSSSQHGLFTIDDEEDDSENEEEEVVFSDAAHSTTKSRRAAGRRRKSDEVDVDAYDDFGVASQSQKITLCGALGAVWTALTFSWVRPLIAIGNQRPLEQADLYELTAADSSSGVYTRFRKYWRKQLKQANKATPAAIAAGKKPPVPSFPAALFHAFGTPFMAVGGLKLFHDSCMFLGPLLLNRLILFLNDPSIPLSTGLYYVLGIFLSNFAMSLCLRQYFWWCYRVGMRLRSAAITAVFQKVL
jgi:hypothetical protein